MAKEYDKQYMFAGKNCICGTMQCIACLKRIDPMKHDWVASKKTDKYGGWGYRTRHRNCAKDQSGWENAEKIKEEFKAKVSALAKQLSVYKEKNGEFSDVLYEALEEIGFEYE